MQALVIEDDDTWAGQVGELLQAEGWQVARVPTAEDAMNRLGRGEGLPDLILLDLVLPKMDGWSFYRHLRTTDAWARLPVMVMTAAQLPDLPLAGIVGYLHKTQAHALDEVRSRIRSWREAQAHRVPAQFQVVIPADMAAMIDDFPGSIRDEAKAHLQNAAQLVAHELPLSSTWLQAITGGDEPTLAVRVDDYRVLVQLDMRRHTLTVIAVLNPALGWRGIG